MPDITAILTLALGFISLCMTIHKSISSSQQKCTEALNDLKLEMAKLRGDLKDYVSHKECHQKREDCPCVQQMRAIQENHR